MRCWLWCVVALAVVCGVCYCTPLDDYVHAYDPTYHWTHNGTIKGYIGYTAYVLRLTSQTWMTSEQSNTPVWTHWLTICVPDAVVGKPGLHTAMMYIDGNSRQPAVY